MDVDAFAELLFEASPSFVTVSVSLSDKHEIWAGTPTSVSDGTASLGASSDDDTVDEVADDFATMPATVSRV